MFTTRSGGLSDVEKTRWPRIGGIKDGPIVGVAFDDDFLARYEPGEEVVGYVAGCEMLRRKAASYHLPLAKAGWTALPDLLERQEDLSRDRYGGWRKIDGVLAEELGCHWEMQRSSLSYKPHVDSPLRLVDRGIAVRLPRSYALRQFEKDMHRELKPCSLIAFAESRSGRAHFHKLGVAPSNVAHFTSYGFGSGRRTNAALEIYLMRPRQDFSRIALIAERLVLAHVLNLAAAA